MITIASACAAAVLVVAAMTPHPYTADTSPDLAGASTTTDSERNSPLRAEVVPRFTKAPATMRIRVLVEPARENRALEIAIDSDGYYRSTAIELAGEHAERVHSVEFRAIPAGDYEVRVSLTGAGGGVRAILHHEVTVYE